jgi:two-component system response regulator PilR (NtrC family)
LPEEGCNLDEVLGEVERLQDEPALERAGGVRTNAAKLLGITLRSLRYRLQKHALSGPDDEALDPDGTPESGVSTPR